MLPNLCKSFRITWRKRSSVPSTTPRQTKAVPISTMKVLLTMWIRPWVEIPFKSGLGKWKTTNTWLVLLIFGFFTVFNMTATWKCAIKMKYILYLNAALGMNCQHEKSQKTVGCFFTCRIRYGILGLQRAYTGWPKNCVQLYLAMEVTPYITLYGYSLVTARQLLVLISHTNSHFGGLWKLWDKLTKVACHLSSVLQQLGPCFWKPYFF